jgi:hypothetical protein
VREEGLNFKGKLSRDVEREEVGASICSICFREKLD